MGGVVGVPGPDTVTPYIAPQQLCTSRYQETGALRGLLISHAERVNEQHGGRSLPRFVLLAPCVKAVGDHVVYNIPSTQQS